MDIANQRLSGSNPKLARPFNEHEVICGYFSNHPRNGVMLDVGAMFGSSFRSFLDLDWQIYAFEPDPLKQLREEFADYPNVHIFDFALADKPDHAVPFFVSHESQGVSTLCPFLASHHEIARVEVRTLAQVVHDEKLRRVDYLKIDTEGFDLRVLEGFPWHRTGSGIFTKGKWPEVILCEFDDQKSTSQGFDHHDLGRFLCDLGYEVFLSEWSPIVEYGRPHSWVSIRKYPCDLLDSKAWGNFVAVSEDGDSQTMRDVMLESAIADRAKLREALAHRDVALANMGQLKENMARRVAEIKDYKEALKKRDESINRLKASLVNKDDGLLRVTEALAERNAGIEELREALAKREATLDELKSKVAARDEAIERLKAGSGRQSTAAFERSS